MTALRRLLTAGALWAALLAFTGTLAATQNIPGQPAAGRPAAVRIYLPLVGRIPRAIQPYGFETSIGKLIDPAVLPRAADLGGSWIRLNEVSWRAVQPEADGPYNWAALANFERELRAASDNHLRPMVLVDNAPRWATIRPTSCGALRADRFDDFARFMEQLVNRYQGPPYNVHHWELGNEVDIDPDIVAPDSVFGCWGDIDDPFYGGGYYGEMLKAVSPAIRAADPQAKILIGGLLLPSPNTTDPAQGKPERFLEGILRSGAAPHFDLVPYHSYPTFYNELVDYDVGRSNWKALGGWTIGKAQFLQAVLEQYGVEKEVILNETALLCTQTATFCAPPVPAYFEMQADFLVRMMCRALWAKVNLITWYTLQGPGWRNAGLLDAEQKPRPAYLAYQQLILQTGSAALPPPRADYGGDVEAYRFRKELYLVDVAWSLDAEPNTIQIPRAEFIAAYDRDGRRIWPAIRGDMAELTVGFGNLYIQRYP